MTIKKSDTQIKYQNWLALFRLRSQLASSETNRALWCTSNKVLNPPRAKRRRVRKTTKMEELWEVTVIQKTRQQQAILKRSTNPRQMHSQRNFLSTCIFLFFVFPSVFFGGRKRIFFQRFLFVDGKRRIVLLQDLADWRFLFFKVNVNVLNVLVVMDKILGICLNALL